MNAVVADVLLAGEHVARFVTQGADTRFEYLPGYAGDPVAHSLPVGVVVDRPGRVLPPFFTNLLPEGRRLSALTRALKASADDELSLLLAVGSNAVGNVQVVPPGQGAEPAAAAVTGTPLDYAELLASNGIDRVALAGVQDKLSAGMITLPGRTRSGGAALIKLDPPDYQHAVENEHYCLRLARRTRERVVEADLLPDRHGRLGLVVKRFDRVPEPLAVEDGCQLLGRYPGDKYLVTAEEVAGAVAAVTAASAVALRSVHLQFVLAWLLGNGDLHAKNLSVVRTQHGDWRVAPIYDTVCTLAYGDHEMALSMGGRKHGFLRRHLVAFGRELGLPEVVATKNVDRALAATDSMEEDLDAGVLPFHPTLRRTLTRQLARRRRDARA